MLNLLYRIIPSRLLAHTVKTRRDRGDYRASTLELAKHAYQNSSNPRYLIQYIRIRRDRGLEPTEQLVEKLCKLIPSITRPHLRNQSLMIVAEHYLRTNADFCRELLLLHADELKTISTPAIAHILVYDFKQQTDLKTEQMAAWFQHQANWRNEWLNSLSVAVESNGVCVVGNGGVLNESALGERIDSHEHIIRFNRFCDAEKRQDIGTKYNTWVINPEIQDNRVQSVQWVIMSGPDVLYTNKAWTTLLAEDYRHAKILTIPLSVWREAVSELDAPPSAGFLVLCWIKEHLKTWENISVAGFNSLADSKSDDIAPAYHITEQQLTASSRHNWHRESILLRQWSERGMNSLHDKKMK